jgi:hypothetical protein
MVALSAIGCLGAQERQTYDPEFLTGVRLGSNRAAVTEVLSARGFREIGDRERAEGQMVVFGGEIDRRPAEVIAWFGMRARGARLINYAVNFPAASPAELHQIYGWLYRRLASGRCPARLQPDYQSQLDSVLAGSEIGIPRAEETSMHEPVLETGTALQPGNMDWPAPSWLSPDAQYGTRLIASRLPEGSAASFQVALWSTTLWRVDGDPTTCADTRQRIAAERAARGSGERDTVWVLISAGASGQVDTLRIPPVPAGSTQREFMLSYPHGTTIEYSFVADSGFQGLKVMTGEGYQPASGSIVTNGRAPFFVEAKPGLRPENKKLYELFRAQLVATDHLAAYIDMKCEMERIMREYPAESDSLIAQAEALAIDKERDRKALIRIDDALGGRSFGDCEDDRRRYRK